LTDAVAPLTTYRRTLLAIILAGAVAACTDAPIAVEVRVMLGGNPVPGLEVTALPYDPTRLLDSLATAHGEPRPAFGDLEQELLAFAPAPAPADDAAGLGVRATRDSVAALADSLNSVDRRSPGYATTYRRFRQLYGRLVQRSAAREAARRGDLDPVRSLALMAGRAADSLRAWERAAYAGLDTATTRLEDLVGRRAVTGVTDAEGWVTLMLPPGAWWFDARLDHPENPFAEYAWMAPAVLSGFPFRIRLTEAAARIVWRH
jgi:hypothetical protein